VPDADKDSDSRGIDEIHPRHVQYQALMAFIGKDPQETLPEQTAGRYVNLAVQGNDGHAAASL
jgi:hypothetical protein